MHKLSDETVRKAVLKNGPKGSWRSVPGTHTNLFNDTIHFANDGTGEIRTGSLMRGEESQRFLWRMAAAGELEVQTIDDATPLDREEPDSWMTLKFSIEQLATDTGPYWVLKERDTDGFWDLMFPLVPDSSV